jgi:molybdenum cofactor synthesis domain-containing protein
MKVGILTVSDRCFRGEREDRSSEVIKESFRGPFEYRVVPDEKEEIKSALIEMSSSCDLILTTGGTGLSPRDVTPEATLEVIDKEIPGIAERMRAEGAKSTPNAVLSRAIAGMRGRTLIINLPGSERGVRESLSAICHSIPHAIEVIKGEAEECGEPRKLFS